MHRFIKNELSFAIIGTRQDATNGQVYHCGIRSDGIWLECVNAQNLEIAKIAD